tara:strand:- start:15163 stop:15426 length:264 start_codon:yes stop_codon:yes gene_type:complete
MSLLDGKRKPEGFGNPEFFTISDDMDDMRIRRSDVVCYRCTYDKDKKEYVIKLYLTSGKEWGYTSQSEDIAKRFMEKLDKLFNVKII